MGTTQAKGDLAVARAILEFTEAGWIVSVPVSESAAYDLVVDTGEEYRLRRVQVKYITGKEVDLRRIHSNAQGYVVKRYEPETYDWLYVYRPGFGSYLRRSFVPNVTWTPQEADLFR